MGLLGTIIGGSLGLFFGGPIGAIIGGALGSNINIKAQKVHPGARNPYGGSTSSRPGYSPIHDQQAFMLALISLAAKVAKADGKVTREEIQTFDNFLKNSLQMDQQERQVAARIFNEARDSEIPAEEFARQIRQLMGHRRDRLRDLISLLLMIAMSDGHFHPAEEQLIRSIATHMGLSASDYEASAAMFKTTNNLDESYAVLGVNESVSDDELKRAYRKLAKEYHPDVLASKGMSEEFQGFAEDKMKNINGAYDEVKKARGL